MRSFLLALTGLISVTLAQGGSFTFTDPFPGSSCANESCDVVGPRENFDIEKIVANIGGSGQVSSFLIYTNWGGNNNLDPYVFNGSTLYLGDLLFTVGGVLKYGIALTGHGDSVNPGAYTGGQTLTQGRLYRIDELAQGILSSNQVMGSNPPSIFRQNVPVWLNQTGGSLTALGSAGTVSAQNLGMGFDPRFIITVNITLPDSVLPDFEAGVWGLSFASATCANDIIEGRTTAEQEPIPEPGTLTLLGAGLAALGVAHRRRR
jgi:hypothetical protein